MRKNFQILLATVLLMSSAVCAAVEMNSGYIEAEGIIYYEGGMSPNQMRRMAILDAYRYLAEETNTLYVSGNSTVKNLRELDETVNAKVEAALNGAKVVSVTRDADGSFHAIVRLPVYGGSQSLAGAVLGTSIELEDFPKPIVRNIHSEVYSGLIIDCRGLSDKICRRHGSLRLQKSRLSNSGRQRHGRILKRSQFNPRGKFTARHQGDQSFRRVRRGCQQRGQRQNP